MTLWQPTDLGAKLTQWWDAADYTAGSNWVDKVGSKSVAPTNTPTKSSTSFNSAYPGVTFNGTNQYFVTTDLTGIPTGSTEGWIWAVYDADSSAGAKDMVNYGDPTGAARRNIFSQATTNAPVVSDGVTTAAHSSGVVVPAMFGGHWVGTTEDGYIDGVAIAASTIGSLNTGTVRLRIGAGVGVAAARFYLGVISDIFITTALTTDERQKLEGWIAHNRGLTGVLDAGHPYKSTAPTTDQTLTPSLFTNTQTFYGPTITTGAVTLSPSLFTNSQTFFAPAVAVGVVDLAPPLLTNAQTFFGPTASPGAVTLTPSLVTNSQTFYAPEITQGGPVLTPSLFTNTQTFFSPAISVGAVNLAPSLVSLGNTIYAPTVLSSYPLLPALLTNSQIFYDPTITTGPVTLLPSLFVNESTINPPTIFAWQSVLPAEGNWDASDPSSGSWAPIEPTAASWA